MFSDIRDISELTSDVSLISIANGKHYILYPYAKCAATLESPECFFLIVDKFGRREKKLRTKD